MVVRVSEKVLVLNAFKTGKENNLQVSKLYEKIPLHILHGVSKRKVFKTIHSNP